MKRDREQLRSSVPPEVFERMMKKSERIKAECDDILFQQLGVFNLVCRSILDTADFIWVDVVSEWNKAGLIKREVKFREKNARKNFNRVYNSIDIDTRSVRDLFISLLDVVNEEVKTDIDRLIFSVKNIVDKNKGYDSLNMARGITMAELFRMADEEGARLTKTCRQEVAAVFRRELLEIPSGFNEQIDQHFGSRTFKQIADSWDALMRAIYPTYTNVLEEVKADSNINRCSQAIRTRLTDAEHMDNISNELIAKDPTLLDEYNKRHAKEK